MNIVNLTPHVLNLRNSAGEMVEIAPSGTVARVSETIVELETVAGFKVAAKTYGDVENLPDAAPDTIYVVSALVLQRVNRPDVFAPGTAIRDTEGKIIGAEGLSAAHTAAPIVISVGNEYDADDVMKAFAHFGIPVQFTPDAARFWPPRLLIGSPVEEKRYPMTDGLSVIGYKEYEL